MRKGYWTGSNYMGWVPEKGAYQKFESEEEYWDVVVRPQLESEDEE